MRSTSWLAQHRIVLTTSATKARKDGESRVIAEIDHRLDLRLEVGRQISMFREVDC